MGFTDFGFELWASKAKIKADFHWIAHFHGNPLRQDNKQNVFVFNYVVHSGSTTPLTDRSSKLLKMWVATLTGHTTWSHFFLYGGVTRWGGLGLCYTTKS